MTSIFGRTYMKEDNRKYNGSLRNLKRSVIRMAKITMIFFPEKIVTDKDKIVIKELEETL